MKVALIATLYNEADNLVLWWDCLMKQTVSPDEIVIVDGGSVDGTWEKLKDLERFSAVPVKLRQHRCNIAEGRNLAISLTDAPIIAASDAGSFPEPSWLAEIIRPLLEDESVDFTGGLNVSKNDTAFQKFLAQLEPRHDPGAEQRQANPSSRNTAFRRQAWADVGGYPEWLTLTGEDALFTLLLNKIGKRFFYNPKAVVHWSVRENEADFFKMLYSYGYGSAEACLSWPYFRQRLVISVFPPVLFISRHRFRHLRFRYLKNLSSARGWLAGKLAGHRPPVGWARRDGLLLSPEAQKYLVRQRPAGHK
jgi:glycosyltransferase involved in cell wall biosynthesis